MAPFHHIDGIGQQPPWQHEHAGEADADHRRTDGQGRWPGQAGGKTRQPDDADPMPHGEQGALAETSGHGGPQDHACELADRHGQQQGRDKIGAADDIAADIEQGASERRCGKSGEQGQKSQCPDHRVAKRDVDAVLPCALPGGAGRTTAWLAAAGPCAQDHRQGKDGARRRAGERQPIEGPGIARILHQRRQQGRDNQRARRTEQQSIARNTAARAAVAGHLRHQRIVRHVDDGIGAPKYQQGHGQHP